MYCEVVAVGVVVDQAVARRPRPPRPRTGTPRPASRARPGRSGVLGAASSRLPAPTGPSFTTWTPLRAAPRWKRACRLGEEVGVWFQVHRPVGVEGAVGVEVAPVRPLVDLGWAGGGRGGEEPALDIAQQVHAHGR